MNKANEHIELSKYIRLVITNNPPVSRNSRSKAQPSAELYKEIMFQIEFIRS